MYSAHENFILTRKRPIDEREIREICGNIVLARSQRCAFVVRGERQELRPVGDVPVVVDHLLRGSLVASILHGEIYQEVRLVREVLPCRACKHTRATGGVLS
jgi:hypothetical protein